MSASEKLLAYAPGRNPAQRFASLPVEVVSALIAVVEAAEVARDDPYEDWRRWWTPLRAALAALDEALGSDVTSGGK